MTQIAPNSGSSVGGAAGEATSPPQHRFDVFLSGIVFMDIIFTGMPSPPLGGREILTNGMGTSPGGVANMAVATARLGLDTALSTAFGADVYGDFCWSTLADQEGIDLSASRRVEQWHSPVTVSMAYAEDRAMVTHFDEPPLLDGASSRPPSRLCFADMGTERAEWVDDAVAAGSMVFADVGWDPTETWDRDGLRARLQGCHAFVPNADEAMAFTGTSSSGAAMEELRDWVPLSVVTAGSGGAFAADARTGETTWVPGVPVAALDPTGAGDVFVAGLMFGELRTWSLAHRLRFANLCAALSVRHVGGALAAPGFADICDWWALARNDARRARDYEFLEDLLASVDHRLFDRAVPTIGFRNPVHDHGRHQPRT